MPAHEEVRLIRRVSFSSGHRYWLQSLSPEENRKLFGRWASPYNHGHNYVLETEITGRVVAETGMVVNIKDLDAILQERVVDVLDQRSLNDEVPYFADRSPSLENLLIYLKDQIGAVPEETRLTRLTLYETPLLWGSLEIHGDDRKMNLTRSYEFAASHRLHNPLLPESENVELYGKCNNPAGHGHNYVLEVTVLGEPDPKTGMIVDLEVLDRTVEERVVDRYDHKNLSEDLPEFRGKIATSEVVVQQIWKELDGAVPAKLERVRLQETARNVFEVSAS
jgi:6-pyruvoyltetrahydropterin/6-carboxytetrahydropterin synthase